MLGPSRAADIVRNQPTAILAVDLEGRACYSNPAASLLLGVSCEEVEGSDVLELFGSPKELEMAISTCLADGEERRVQIEMRRGIRVIPLGVSVAPCVRAPHPLAIILSFRDIEERQLLEERVVKIERMASVGRLTAGFAHQLRNPLAAVSALAENLAAEIPANDPRGEYTSRILGQVARIEALIRACLDFDFDPQVVRQKWDAGSIAREALDSFAARHDQVPFLMVEPNTPQIEVCGEQVAECLRRLLDNAFEACGATSMIEVAVSSLEYGERRMVSFVVRDQGPGIAKDDMPLIFEPFFSTKAQGTGLGLAAAQTLVMRNSGVLEFDSRPGDTRFTLRFPAFLDSAK